jgi:hypothetical protein
MRGCLAPIRATRHAVFADQPWRLLAEFVPDLRVQEHAFGAGYLTAGHYAPEPP